MGYRYVSAHRGRGPATTPDDAGRDVKEPAGAKGLFAEVGLYLCASCSIGARARQEIAALIGAGYRTTLITDRETAEPEVVAGLEAIGATVTLLSAPGVGGRFQVVTKELSFGFAARRLLARSDPPRLVVSHSAGITMLLPILTLLRGVPTAHVLHGLMWSLRRRGANPCTKVTTAFYLLIDHWAARTMSAHIAVSEAIRCDQIALGASSAEVHTVHNSLDLSVFHPIPEISKDVDILFVGRLSLEKGVDVLLDALVALPASTRVIVAGDGPLRDSLATEATRLPCQVDFLGWVGHDDLPTLINRSKLLVVPSRAEPFGVVVLEAMACGTPVVGSDVQGIPELIADGLDGWLVPPGDSAALAAALREALANNEELRKRGNRAAASVMSFSPDSFAERIVPLYEALMRPEVGATGARR